MQTVLITGANRGIGLALTRHCHHRGERVIGVCRKRSAELDASGVQVEAGIDVTDAQALASLTQRLDGTRIDRLLLNAGVLATDVFGSIDESGFEDMRKQFEVNSLGPLRVAQALRDRLADDAKIGIITSRMGSMADNGSGGYYGYRASKAAVNAIGRSLAFDLRPRGIAVFLLHPGYVATDMVGGRGEVSAEHAAAQLVARMDTLTLAETGTFWHANGTELPW